jgi:hypothetical protein
MWGWIVDASRRTLPSAMQTCMPAEWDVEARVGSQRSFKQSVAQAGQVESIVPTTAASPSRKPRARRKTG